MNPIIKTPRVTNIDFIMLILFITILVIMYPTISSEVCTPKCIGKSFTPPVK